ncbi:MAG: hypothetical protein A2808_02635 [Candidatus Moranbacteria bacterium RIFCSPHIGHO2_01_FULL_55_24]|nr:MAG: hypothetical protein A2808_02635 [Candidatus Moranbacteria bacterium RIFCSPHIGHO2_01_FULL_55_24]
MQSKELKEMLEKNPSSLLIIDVRETDEVADQPLLPSRPKNYVNLPVGFVCSLPKDELKARLEECAGQCGKTLDQVTLVVSCRSGGRSSLAQEKLKEHSIAAENLDGGYLGW